MTATLRDVQPGDRIRLDHMRDDYSYRVVTIHHGKHSARIAVETPDGRCLSYRWQNTTRVRIVRADR